MKKAKRLILTMLATISILLTLTLPVSAAVNSYTSYLEIAGGAVHLGDTRTFNYPYYGITMTCKSVNSGQSKTSCTVSVCTVKQVGGTLLSYTRDKSAEVNINGAGTTTSKYIGRAGAGKKAFEFKTSNPWRYGFKSNYVYMYSSSSSL